MAFLLEKLEVYKKALDLAEQITDLTENFPRGTHYLADQLNRAVLSISANIAEGSGVFIPKIGATSSSSPEAPRKNAFGFSKSPSAAV